MANLIYGHLQEIQESTDIPTAATKAQSYFDKIDNIPLNIAITGETGAGKSTFVNAIRGIDNKHPNAAPTGAVETTMEPTAYPHPSYKNVTLWDLPGIGTTKFPASRYLKKMQAEMFDFFIIISSDRFRENDGNLARELTKMKKLFYFVRSKIDNVIQDEQRSQRHFNAAQTLQLIRKNCIQSLQDLGVRSPQVFLLSSVELHLYDFNDLTETLERELPSHKKNALVFSLPCTSKTIIDKKYKAFKTQIIYRALASMGVAAIPLPGLSFTTDVAILISALIQYRCAFGLTNESLQKLAFITHTNLNDLLSVRTSPIANEEINKELIINLLGRSACYAACTVAEEALRFIPAIGTVSAMGISFITTYNMLNKCLDMAAKDAHNVLKAALPDSK